MLGDRLYSDRDCYFANDQTDRLVEYLEHKSVNWFTKIINNNHFDKIKASWQAYYGIYYNYNHTVSFSGEQGELVNIAINHFRNIGEHTIRMICANRPSFQARASNTDARSQIQVNLANGLLEYYMREKKLEDVLERAVQYAVILSAGYIKMEWDATSGEIYDYIRPMKYNKETDQMEPELDPQTGEPKQSIPVYEGDVKFSNLSPFDVVFDSTKETPDDHDWVLIRSFKNKWDLIAKYPELTEQIKDVQIEEREGTNRIMFSAFDSTHEVPVYEFFHRRTPAVPNGRYIIYLNPQTVLSDTPTPYRELPVYRVSPDDVMGTPYGYTIMFDLLPIQEAINTTHSTILTNINALGVQNILNPRGNGVTIEELESGMNFVEFDKELGPPTAMAMCHTPPDVYQYLNKLEQSIEIISAINSVVRGDPQASLKSGTSLALVQSQALQFISHLQQSYIKLIESVGTGLINLLRDFAAVPRIAAISGISNKTKMQQFKGEDISLVNRVIVDAGNAIASTPAGRTQIAQDLIQMGLITTPQEYLQVMTTGKLEVLTGGQTDDLILIKDENERLINGDGPVSALSFDPHVMHLHEHRSILSDTLLRYDPAVIQRVTEHINEHMNLLRTVDPQMLQIFGQPSLAQPQQAGPMGPPPPGMQPHPQQPPHPMMPPMQHPVIAHPPSQRGPVGNNIPKAMTPPNQAQVPTRPPAPVKQAQPASVGPGAPTNASQLPLTS